MKGGARKQNSPTATKIPLPLETARHFHPYSHEHKAPIRQSKAREVFKEEAPPSLNYLRFYWHIEHKPRLTVTNRIPRMQ